MEVDIGSTSWRIGPASGEPVVVVRDAAPSVLAWLIGRGSIEGAPTPPAWL
jgi:hypothetical protein